MKDKLTMLMILDGFGDNKNEDGNAIKLAKTAYCVTLNGSPSGTSQLL